MSHHPVVRLSACAALAVTLLFATTHRALAEDQAEPVRKKIRIRLHKPDDAGTTKAEPAAKPKDPMDSVMRWAMGQLGAQMGMDGHAQADGAGGPNPAAMLKGWFDGGDDVPMAGLRDALKADGWTSDKLQMWMMGKAMQAGPQIMGLMGAMGQRGGIGGGAGKPREHHKTWLDATGLHSKGHGAKAFTFLAPGTKHGAHDGAGCCPHCGKGGAHKNPHHGMKPHGIHLQGVDREAMGPKARLFLKMLRRMHGAGHGAGHHARGHHARGHRGHRGHGRRWGRRARGQAGWGMPGCGPHGLGMSGMHGMPGGPRMRWMQGMHEAPAATKTIIIWNDGTGWRRQQMPSAPMGMGPMGRGHGARGMGRGMGQGMPPWIRALLMHGAQQPATPHAPAAGAAHQLQWLKMLEQMHKKGNAQTEGKPQQWMEMLRNLQNTQGDGQGIQLNWADVQKFLQGLDAQQPQPKARLRLQAETQPLEPLEAGGATSEPAPKKKIIIRLPAR